MTPWPTRREVIQLAAGLGIPAGVIARDGSPLIVRSVEEYDTAVARSQVVDTDSP